MMKKRILVDVDGVIGDFSDGFIRIANKFAGTSYTTADVTSWDLDTLPGVKEHSAAIWSEVGAPGFARHLRVYPGAKEGLAMLANYGEVFIVTAPIWVNEPEREPLHGQTFCFDRVKWLEEHFGIHPKKVIFCYHKELVEGDMLIDDKVENIKGWLENHGSKKGTRAVLWEQRYNEGFGGHHPRLTRTSSWADVEKLLSR